MSHPQACKGCVFNKAAYSPECEKCEDFGNYTPEGSLLHSAPAPLPKGLKYDGGKQRWSLLMRGLARPLAGVVAVLTFGAKKYADDSWQAVEGARGRYKDALYRHLSAIEIEGLDAVDPESGELHIDHVVTNALFLAHFARE